MSGSTRPFPRRSGRRPSARPARRERRRGARPGPRPGGRPRGASRSVGSWSGAARGTGCTPRIPRGAPRAGPARPAGARPRGSPSRARRDPGTQSSPARCSSVVLLAQVALELAPDLRAGAVQEHSLIDLRQVQSVTYIGRAPAEDVAETDHLALVRRERLDRAGHPLERLVAEEAFLGDPLPIVRRPPPLPRRDRVVVRMEPIRVDARLVGPGVPDRGERRAPPLALPSRLRGVHQDPEDPRPEGGPALEPVDPLQHADPGFLHDVLGDGSAGDVQEREAEHRRPVPLDEGEEGGLVASTERLERAGVLGAGRRVYGRAAPTKLSQLIGRTFTTSPGWFASIIVEGVRYIATWLIGE